MQAHPANQVNGAPAPLDPDNRRPGTAKDLIPLGICCSLVGLILLLVLLPLSFVTLEYYEYGLKRSRTRGVVDTEVIYGPGGRWFMNPDTEFQVLDTFWDLITSTQVHMLLSDHLRDVSNRLLATASMLWSIVSISLDPGSKSIRRHGLG